MITLQQAFYGRDPQVGYRLLAASDPTHNKVIERLCAAIGTPDGVSTVEPFYINYVNGDLRYMIRGCIGNQDDAGRKTLFFHAYIGDHKRMRSINFGIGNLIHDGAFLHRYEKTPALPHDFEESNYSLPWGNSSFAWDRGRLAIVSKKPEFTFLTGLLKGNINDENWASFSFRPLNDFKIYVLSEYAPVMPSDRKCIDTSGMLRRMEQSPLKPPSPQKTQQPCQRRKASNRNILWVFLALSITINILLAWKCFNAPTTDNHNSEKSSDIKPQIVTVTKEVPVKGAVTRQQVLQDLRTEFLQNNKPITGSWDDAMRRDPALKIQYEKYAKEPLLRARGYVDFVNNIILNTGDQK